MYKILCLDNDPISSLILRRLLEGKFQVQIADNYASCFQALKKDEFDAILLDIDLGTDHIKEVDIMRMIRNLPNGETTKVIAITAFASPKEHQKLLFSGFDAHISKPISQNSLCDILFSFLETTEVL